MKKFTFILLTILLTVGIPFAAMNVPLLENVNTTDAMAYVLGFLTITSAIIIGILQYHIETVQGLQKKMIAKQEANDKDIEESINQLQLAVQDMNEISIYPVDRDLVYNRLRHFTNEARRRVDLMYFASHPPTYYLKSQTKDQYIDTLDAVIAGKKKNVRQIILYTSNNKDWIKSLVGKHKDNDRFSLSIIEEDYTFPLVSTQVFDDETAIIMNLDKSVTPNKPRDLVIQSKKIFPIFDSYYQEMYKLAIPIVHNGIINSVNYEKYF